MTWKKAAEIAFFAMGRIDDRHSQYKWRADEDPLAWWCLVEWIYDEANPRARRRKKGTHEPGEVRP